MKSLVPLHQLSLLVLENRYPLRKYIEPFFSHNFRNLSMAALNGLTISFSEKPLAEFLTRVVDKNKFGLVKLFRLSPRLELLVTIALLDYTLYLWHVLTHKVPFLWRFHEVHHEDLDLTSTTGIRFHFGEMFISAFYRAAQILIIGVSPTAYSLWQNFTIWEILFHHANWKIPEKLEAALSSFIVTPRMHGIHHSNKKEETNSNWSSGLTIWDKLHGTLKLSVPQSKIQIGVPEDKYMKSKNLWSLIKRPFLTMEVNHEKECRT